MKKGCCQFPSEKAIIIGGGLAGFAAAHTIAQAGGRALLLDKSPYTGGNSVKASSGINGANTRSQTALNIKDSSEGFIDDTLNSGSRKPCMARVLAEDSAASLHWLMDKYDVDFSFVSQLGGHSVARTHRGADRLPGRTITHALMDNLPEDGRIHVVNNARVVRIIKNDCGCVVGCEWVDSKSSEPTSLHEEHGPVIVASGGFGASAKNPGSLLAKYRPDLLDLPTTNGPHCTGDGMVLAENVGASLIDMDCVQVHPTGLVNTDDPHAYSKFLGAEALRGVGGILINGKGKRFCNELGRRDYVSGEMRNQRDLPIRLVLNGKAYNELKWHCDQYVAMHVMKVYTNVAALAQDMNVPASDLSETVRDHDSVGQGVCEGRVQTDEFGKKFFHNIPTSLTEELHVAIVTPVVHYCMGGVEIDENACVLDTNGHIIPGLFAAGEVTGGVHGTNRLGGSSLLDALVFGRRAGMSCDKYMFGASDEFRPLPKLD